MTPEGQEETSEFMEQARRLAEEHPDVECPPCVNEDGTKHEGHLERCYNDGWNQGFDEALERAKKLIESGRFKTFAEVYEHYHSGMIAT